MPYVKRTGQPDIHYVVDDYTDPWRNAPYLVLQHGNGRSSRFWYSWIPYLSRFYKVVRPDARGLGQSGANFDLASAVTVENLTGDILSILDQLGAQSVHFCGESMGGILGIALAAMQPQRIRTLTLPDIFQDHDTLERMYELAGLDARSIAASAIKALGRGDERALKLIVG